MHICLVTSSFPANRADVSHAPFLLSVIRVLQQAGHGIRVSLPGRLSDDALAEAYRSADCLVIPSRSESIPLVLGEAVQQRLPLIVTDVGDMAQLVRRYQLGEVVAAGDPVRPGAQPRSVHRDALAASTISPANSC